jgi:hypothetical protein
MGGARKMGEARVSWVTGIIFKMFAGNSKIYFHIYSMKIVWIYCGFLDANIIFIVWISLFPVCPDLSILVIFFLFFCKGSGRCVGYSCWQWFSKRSRFISRCFEWFSSTSSFSYVLVCNFSQGKSGEHFTSVLSCIWEVRVLSAWLHQTTNYNVPKKVCILTTHRSILKTVYFKTIWIHLQQNIYKIYTVFIIGVLLKCILFFGITLV